LVYINPIGDESRSWNKDSSRELEQS